MTEPALRVDSVWKKYRRGEAFDSLRDWLPALVRNRFRPGQDLAPSEFWAVRDVSFAVAPGEAFGIVGHNGAGKSTLLKLLSRIIQPTRGSLTVNGRMSALIEVGAGFHPDLTGRENVYLSGTILGMKREEVAAKFDAIVEFSGLAPFIDTPVKRYSSGMFARLGFSVAAHIDPEVLIVDEVLSVGDYVFQRKCMDRMNEVMRNGAAIVFVSHNLRAVVDLCQNGILMDRGEVAARGPIDLVIRRYLERAAESIGADEKPGVITSLAIRGASGNTVDFTAGERVRIDVSALARERVAKAGIVIGIEDENFYLVFHTGTERLGSSPVDLEPGERLDCSFDLDLHLGPGTYHINAYLYRYDVQQEYDRRTRAISFFVSSDRDGRGAANLYPRVCRNEKAAV